MAIIDMILAFVCIAGAVGWLAGTVYSIREGRRYAKSYRYESCNSWVYEEAGEYYFWAFMFVLIAAVFAFTGVFAFKAGLSRW